MVRLLLFAEMLATLCLIGRRAYGQSGRAGLVVTREAGTEDCPSATELAAAVQRLVRETVVVASTDGVQRLVYVELSRSFEGFRAILRPHGASRWKREISDIGPRCNSLGEALAVTLAMLLEEPGALGEPAEPRPRIDRAPEGPPLASRPPRYFPEIGGGMAFGILSAPSPLVTAGLDYALTGAFFFGIGGTYVGPGEQPYLGGVTRLDLGAGWIRACAIALGEATGVGIRLCVQPMLGALHGNATGYWDARSRLDAWPAIALGASAHGRLGPWLGWWLSASAVLPLLKQGFSVKAGDAVVPVFSTPDAGAFVALGVRAIL